MSVLRLFAVIVIFAAVSFAWVALGGSMVVRTEMLDSSLSAEMANLWGPKVLVQQAPYISAGGSDKAASISPSASTITADIDHKNRYKGLLWYSTFTVKFDASYTIPAAAGAAKQTFFFPLPPQITTYAEQPRITVDGKPWTPQPGELAGGKLAVPIDGTAEHVVHVSYSTGAQDEWLYVPSEAAGTCSRDDATKTGGGAMVELNNFSLTVKTNFPDIDYPKGTRSPSEPATPTPDGGRSAKWHFASAMTNQGMGVLMPQRQNAGPIAARMSFFAPVSLLFFFTAMFTVVVLKKIPLHPMHYLFISAGFFAFHILMAYLVDLVNIHAVFWICAAVSVLLVVSYLRLVAGAKFAVLYAGLAQLVFLVGFSYAFFWTGYTGLTITVCAILTLLVIMQATGKVNWNEVFKPRPRAWVSPDPDPTQAPVPPAPRGPSTPGANPPPLPPG